MFPRMPLGTSWNFDSWNTRQEAGRRLCPAQPLDDRLAHDPILVVLRQERQLFSEVSHPLLVSGLGERVGDVGAPMAAARAVSVVELMDGRRDVAPGVGLLGEQRRC